MTHSEPTLWAQKQFGQANLKDPRRTQRLVTLAASLAEQPGVSVAKLPISPADMEGAYRFIRNENIKAVDIAEPGFQVTATSAQTHDLLLALEDTTTLSYSHRSVRKELGHSNQGNRSRAILVHSTLLFAPTTHTVVGLVEQQRWTRDITKRGQGHLYATRPYEEKESYKWEQTSRNTAERLGSAMTKTISVCDRGADLIEYLTYKYQHQQRFVVRSMQSRCIEEHENSLYDYSSKLSNIPLYYVGCIEQGKGNKNLEWHLLTSEKVESTEDALKIISYYERRWLIEDFHKVWRSGRTEVESLPMHRKCGFLYTVFCTGGG